MMHKRFVAIGHITNDTEPTPHLGGGVSYTAVAATRLGYEAHIITKCPKEHPYVKELRDYGVNVHILPTKLQTVSTHQNIHDETGRKRQRIWDVQEVITEKEFDLFPKDILQDAQILLTPMNDEVDVRLSGKLSNYGTVTIEPSGYYRKIESDRRVVAKEWKDFDKAIGVSTLILGEQDIAFEQQKRDMHLRKLYEKFRIVVLTEGDNGIVVFTNRAPSRTSPYPLRKEEYVDFTGAGDTYAAAFILYLAKSHDPKIASVFATFFAAVKITGVGGIGIASIPTRAQLDEFKEKHKEQVAAFLEKNNSSEDALSL